MKENILTYLEEQISKNIPTMYDVEVEWNKKEHQIYIIMQLYAMNNQKLVIEDIDGNLADEVITFEDVILLNAGKKSVNQDDYLAVIDFDRKQGIAKNDLDQLIKNITITLDEGQSDLLDFISGETELFELHFDPISLNKTQDMLKYPKF